MFTSFDSVMYKGHKMTMRAFFIVIYHITVIKAWNVELIQTFLIKNPSRGVSLVYCDEIEDDIKALATKLSSTMTSLQLYNLKKEGTVSDLLSFKPFDTTILIDLECQNATYVLNVASDLKLFNGSRTWLLLGHQGINVSQSLFETLNINIDSKIFLIEPFENDYKIYKISSPALQRSNILNVELIGKYFVRKGVLRYKDKINNFKKDLQEIRLSVAIAIEKTPKNSIFVKYAEGHGYGHRDSFIRLSYQFVMLHAELYNFRIHIKKAVTWGYPVHGQPGQWDGVVGMLQRHEADYGAVSLTYLPSRHPVIDSGLSVQKFRQFFVFRHPCSTGIKNIFFKPFQTDVWISLLFMLLLTAIILCIIYSYDTKDKNLIDTAPFISSTLTVIGIVANQGITMNFNSMQARITLLFCLIMSVVCGQFYSATIVSSLLTPAPRTITTVKALSRSKLDVIMEDVITSRGSLWATVDEDLIYLRETKVKKHPELYSIEDGVALVKKGNYAFYTHVDYAYDFIRKAFTSTELDELQEIPYAPPDHRSMLYMAVEKHSPFKELIRVGNLKFAETGIRSYLTMKFTSKTPRGNLKSLSFRTEVVDIEAFSPILYMLCIGMLFSLVILICEIIFARIVRRK